MKRLRQEAVESRRDRETRGWINEEIERGRTGETRGWRNDVRKDE
jgi:hypothetical protein